MTSVRSHFTPDIVRVKEGDSITWHITNIDTAQDATHGFAIPGPNINLSIEPGETTSDLVRELTGLVSTRSTAPSSARRFTWK